jgi:hypothetical protein
MNASLKSDVQVWKFWTNGLWLAARISAVTLTLALGYAAWLKHLGMSPAASHDEVEKVLLSGPAALGLGIAAVAAVSVWCPPNLQRWNLTGGWSIPLGPQRILSSKRE